MHKNIDNKGSMPLDFYSSKYSVDPDSVDPDLLIYPKYSVEPAIKIGT